MPTLPSSFPIPFPGSADSASVQAYVRQLRQLLPRGRAFGKEGESTVSNTLYPTAVQLSGVEHRGIDLINESDPRTAQETLAEWERMLSLPDDQIQTIPGSIAERQIAITQKYIARGGQNYEFFELLCAACGYTLISIDKFALSMLRAGFRVGDRCFDSTWAYTMRLNLETPTGPAGSFLNRPSFEAVVRHHTHAHITAVFTYS